MSMAGFIFSGCREICLRQIVLPSTFKGCFVRIGMLGLALLFLCSTVFVVSIYTYQNPRLTHRYCSDELRLGHEDFEPIKSDNWHRLTHLAEVELGNVGVFQSDGTFFSPNGEILAADGLAFGVSSPAYGTRLWNLDEGCTTDIGNYRIFSIWPVAFGQASSRIVMKIGGSSFSAGCGIDNEPPFNSSLVLDPNSGKQLGLYASAEFVNYPTGERLSYVPCDQTQEVSVIEGNPSESDAGYSPEARMFSPENQLYVTTEPDGTVSLWTTQGNHKVMDAGPNRDDKWSDHEVQIFSFSPDSRWFVLQRWTGLEIWDIENQEMKFLLGDVGHYEFSLDGKLLGRSSRIWNLESGDVQYD